MLEGHALSWPQAGGRDGPRFSKTAHFPMAAVLTRKIDEPQCSHARQRRIVEFRILRPSTL